MSVYKKDRKKGKLPLPPPLQLVQYGEYQTIKGIGSSFIWEKVEVGD
jgi:hypothetical protein